MKLRTKFQDEDFELGEVVDADIATAPDGRIKLQAVAKAGGLITIFYDKLEELYSEWEDVPEKPKTFGWRIDEYNDPEEIGFGFSLEELEYLKEIGLWFESEEETKRAVKKLKAFRRLKDKGFRFKNWESYEETSGLSFPDRHIVNSYTAIFDFNKPCRKYEIEDKVKDDLDLLFGGEE